ncbi:MAG: glutamate racemase [Clostridia bacterium]|nr:glutamate racemase [Clostridia bacterium]
MIQGAEAILKQPKTIGFLDSGIGGLTVLSEALHRIPGADILFYADTDHVPYGTKTREEIVGFAVDAVETLCERGAEAVVVACNTATSMAIRQLRERFPIPIVGMEPAVKPAALIHPGERVLVCATPVTIRGEKLHTLIDRSFREGVRPTLAALPGLVTLAEEERFDFDSVRDYLRSVLDFGEHYAAVVLGCTHFTYFRDSFRSLFPGADILDGNAGTVNRLVDLIGGEIPGKGTITFLESGRLVAEPEPLARFGRYLERMRNL